MHKIENSYAVEHIELIDYYIKCPEKEVEHINPTDIVTPEILRSRNNVIIYPEDILGNPAEQKYIVRWLFYFPIPEAVKMYNFNISIWQIIKKNQTGFLMTIF